MRTVATQYRQQQHPGVLEGAPTVTGLQTQVSKVLVYCVGEKERRDTREAWLALISNCQLQRDAPRELLATDHGGVSVTATRGGYERVTEYGCPIVTSRI